MINESHVAVDIQMGPMMVSIEHLVFLAVLLAVKTVHCGVLWRRERRSSRSEDRWQGQQNWVIICWRSVGRDNWADQACRGRAMHSPMPGIKVKTGSCWDVLQGSQQGGIIVSQQTNQRGNHCMPSLAPHGWAIAWSHHR